MLHNYIIRIKIVICNMYKIKILEKYDFRINASIDLWEETQLTTSLFVSFLLQPLRMCVDHLRELLHHVVEGVVVPRHVALADLLIEGGQPQQRHDVRVSATHRNVQRLLP